VSTHSRGYGVFRSRGKPHVSALGSFVESLIQTFENCRAALPDSVDQAGADRFFVDIYEKELPRLAEMIGTLAPDLSRQRSEAFYREVDGLIRKVVIPAYTRLAVTFTPRERNDFYLVKSSMHGLERVGWTVAGIALGGIAIKAPFIPLWAPEWLMGFMLGGFLFPNLRRYLAFRRFERDANRVVTNADEEIQRMNMAYLTSENVAASVPVEPVREREPSSLRGKDRVH
jgi:hypothetical protein